MKKFKYVVDENGCWNCTSHFIDKDGYPRVTRNYKTQMVVRYLYEKKFGKIEEGFCVCHKCDNTRCINLDHVYAGTRYQNTNDMKVRNRIYKPTGELNPNAKLTREQVEAIKRDRRTQTEIAKEYGVTQPHVSLIKKGGCWNDKNSA